MKIYDPDSMLASLSSGEKAAKISMIQSDDSSEIEAEEFVFYFTNRCQTTTFELENTTLTVVNHVAGDTDAITTALSSLLKDTVSSESDGDGYSLCSSLRHYFLHGYGQLPGILAESAID